jgi:hypothetical protein
MAFYFFFIKWRTEFALVFGVETQGSEKRCGVLQSTNNFASFRVFHLLANSKEIHLFNIQLIHQVNFLPLAYGIDHK